MTASERRPYFEALVLPPAIAASIRVFGLARTQASLRRWCSAGSGASRAPASPDTLQRVIAAHRSLYIRHFLRGTCLTRSLSLWAMLLRRGLETDLRIGFRQSGGKVEGHAWVEFEGTPLADSAGLVQTYTASSQSVSFDSYL